MKWREMAAQIDSVVKLSQCTTACGRAQLVILHYLEYSSYQFDFMVVMIIKRQRAINMH